MKDESSKIVSRKQRIYKSSDNGIGVDDWRHCGGE